VKLATVAVMSFGEKQTNKQSRKK